MLATLYRYWVVMGGRNAARKAANQATPESVAAQFDTSAGVLCNRPYLQQHDCVCNAMAELLQVNNG